MAQSQLHKEYDTTADELQPHPHANAPDDTQPSQSAAKVDHAFIQ